MKKVSVVEEDNQSVDNLALEEVVVEEQGGKDLGKDLEKDQEEKKLIQNIDKKLKDDKKKDNKINKKKEEFNNSVEELCSEANSDDNSISDISTTNSTLSTSSKECQKDKPVDSTIDETKKKCECFGCICKKTDKKKKKEEIYEEPVYTDSDEKKGEDDEWTDQRKHHFQKCLWKLKYNRVVTNVYLNNLKKEEDTWSWRLICLSTFTSGLTVANNVEDEPIENYNIVVNGALTFMSMLTSVCAAWLKKKNFVEKINEIDKYVLNVNKICEELDVQFSILDTDRMRYDKFRKKYKDEITGILSASPIIPPDDWKKSIQEITIKYPELINPDNSEENKLWPWFGDMVYQKKKQIDGTYKKIKVRKETAFMDQMRNTTTHKLKSSCCFNKRDEKDIYK